MTTIDELNIQNHKLAESSNVLLYLIQERSMCDTETACHLLFSALDQVTEHMKTVDYLYKELLTDENTETRNIAEMFMSGEHELRRIINQYIKKWCKTKSKDLRINNHDQFAKDSQEMFELVLSRIQDETEHLYPLFRKVSRTAA